MPLHDWSPVLVDVFHDFRFTWLLSISRALNSDLLRDGLYALAEPVAAGVHETVLDHEDFDRVEEFVQAHTDPDDDSDQGRATWYAVRADRIGVYREPDRLVAFLEILSPGDLCSDVALQRIDRRIDDALTNGLHISLVNVIGEARPRGVWTYSADGHPVRYQPVSIGHALPDLPLVLGPEESVDVPLEATYCSAWNGIARECQRIVERASAQPNSN